MACEHRVLDYQYATWYKCRDCGAMVERVDLASPFRQAVKLMQVPFPVTRHAARPHAHGHLREAE